MIRMRFLIWILVGCAVLNVELEAHRFGYSQAEQRQWKRKHSVRLKCESFERPSIIDKTLRSQHCSGPHQSPIAIHSRRSIPNDMPAIEFIYYHNPLPGPLQIHNNGHSVSLNINKNGNSTSIPYIFGGKLQSEFEFVGLHYHWGGRRRLNNQKLLTNCNSLDR